MSEARALAENHDSFMDGKTWLDLAIDRPLRHVVEVRHSSFLVPEFSDLLREYRIGWVIADASKHLKRHDDVTGDAIYFRLHGDNLPEQNYGPTEIANLAKDIEEHAAGQLPEGSLVFGAEKPLPKARDIYVLFDNDTKAMAPANALALMAQLGISSPVE